MKFIQHWLLILQIQSSYGWDARWIPEHFQTSWWTASKTPWPCWYDHSKFQNSKQKNFKAVWIFSLNSSNFVSDVIWMRFGWMARRYIPSSLLQTFFALIFGIDLFTYHLFCHCRPCDGTPGNCFFQKFCYQHAYECITNEKTKAHSPENIMWSELGKKTYKLKRCIIFNFVPVTSSP